MKYVPVKLRLRRSLWDHCVLSEFSHSVWKRRVYLFHGLVTLPVLECFIGAFHSKITIYFSRMPSEGIMKPKKNSYWTLTPFFSSFSLLFMPKCGFPWMLSIGKYILGDDASSINIVYLFLTAKQKASELSVSRKKLVSFVVFCFFFLYKSHFRADFLHHTQLKVSQYYEKVTR